MSNEHKPEELVEDLDVPAEDGDQVKGGIQDGTSNTLMIGEAVVRPGAGGTQLQKACATGKHLPEATITH